MNTACEKNKFQQKIKIKYELNKIPFQTNFHFQQINFINNKFVSFFFFLIKLTNELMTRD